MPDAQAPGLFHGSPVVVTDVVGTVQIPDHRSPSRAARRAKLGHPQHFRTAGRVVVLADGSIYMHPLAWTALRVKLDVKVSRT